MAESRLRIALAQLDLTVGDIAGNAEKILAAHAEAAKQKADLVVFPEMAITGYPAEDLVLRKSFQRWAMQAAEEIGAQAKKGPALLVGGLTHEHDFLYNASFWMEAGKIQHVFRKVALPNYGVFDEKRLFRKGPAPEVVEWRGMRLGILICEDMWHATVPRHLMAQGAELIIVQNASPYEVGKDKDRRAVAARVVKEVGAPLIYLNTVGGQDELVFDGRSFVMNVAGTIEGRFSAFEEQVALTEWKKGKAGWQCESAPQHEPRGDNETVYNAMVLGLRDYVEKNGFKGVVLGLSGGVDSGLTAAVAVDALGAKRVRAVMMPSRFTSQDSFEDAEACAKALGIVCDTIPIEPAVEAYDGLLKPLFKSLPRDTTEENIQARIRGNMLMAVSNKLGLMVLTTGNKSELSVGYATLYGDMCGGYSVLKDVYKTTVFKLSHWRNKHMPSIGMGPKGRVIPERMITKPPTAELRANQKDEDSLPPYAELDAILLRLVEQRKSGEEIVKEGYPRKIVEKVIGMFYNAEYKRRQSPPGVKTTGMAFGRDWRYPITNRFKR